MECSTSYQNCTVADQASSDEELKKSAGEILNGIKRTVEVQVVNPPSTFNFQESAILGKGFADLIRALKRIIE